ncbi:MAG: RDD family protein [Candidatus Competibacteraceae bacterium]|nr:RDD family protein [Candidatus Competibacteraceae bacterium]
MTDTSVTAPAAGLLRRLGAILYDTLLLAALWMIATAPLLLLTRGAAIGGAYIWPFRAYLLLLSFLFFGWFWTHGGQTLGMRAWKLQLTDSRGGSVDWQQSLIRFLAAMVSWLALGLGFAWVLMDREKRAWHDHLSNTRLVVNAPPRKT